MDNALHRHDIADASWELITPHLPGKAGDWGGFARDNRLFINAVIWILRAGAPWRDLPPEYGNWNSVHRRFARWRDKGVWEHLLDATHAKAHRHAAGAVGGSQAISRTKGG